jgi:hypothetical protein
MVLTRFRPILQKLVDHNVDFIVVGGIAAMLRAAPIVTLDLDVVHSRTPENLPRLIAALNEMDAHYRFPAERRLRPKDSHVAGPGHVLLITQFGPLDVLGTIGKGRAYPDLLPHSTVEEITPELRVRVLNLDTLIQTKEEAGRDKDTAALPTLRATLAEVKRRQATSSTTPK